MDLRNPRQAPNDILLCKTLQQTRSMQAVDHLKAGALSSENGTMIQQVYGVTTYNGDVVLAGGNVNIQKHYHIYPEPRPSGIVNVLRLVRNLRKVHLDVLSRATLGTGIWLFKTDEFVLWLDPNGLLRILWGTGIPGAGKTVLASIVINELEARAAAAGGSVCVCYVYFRYSDAAGITVRSILEILVKQTVERHPECAAIAEEAYAQHLNEDTQPTEAELLQLLHQFTGAKSTTFYILDALDEAPDKVQLEIIKKLGSLNVRLFVTSRPLKDVESRLPGARSFQVVAQAEDLEIHINQEIERSASLQGLLEKGGPSLREELVTSIKKNCDGMFLHASLQLDALVDCFSPRELRRTLQAFPSSIEDVYLQTWDRILKRNPTRVSLAKTVLVWVLNAARSMSLEELEHAVATSPDTYKFEPGELMSGTTLIALCRGLVSFEEESNVVRLVHYTAKETLQALIQDSFPHPHSHLAAVSTTHLAECGFQNTTISSEEELTATLEADPLLAYASEAWGTHARASLDVEESKHRTTKFVKESNAFPTFTRPGLAQYFDIVTSLHILAIFNLPLSLLTCDDIDDPNVPTKIHHSSPLMLASWYGHKEAFASLSAHPKIHADLLNDDKWSVLMAAALSGDESIVKHLITRSEVEVNLVDNEGWSALMLAVGHGYEGIVNLLLACPKIKVNLVNNKGWSALMLAAEYGHDGLVASLLAHPEIQVNLVDKTGQSPLMIAASGAFESCVQSLLSRPEIQVNLVTNNGSSALMSAACSGHEGIFKLFLTHPETQVDLVNKEGRSAFIMAASNGNEDIVAFLLERPETQVNSVDNDGWSALMWGVRNGHGGTVQLLLTRSEIQVSLIDNEGWSALMLAANDGCEDIAKLLLARPEIQVNLVNEEGYSALMLAAEAGHETLSGLFLGVSHIDTEIKSAEDGRTAMSLALENGHVGIVQLLQEFESRRKRVGIVASQDRLSLDGPIDEEGWDGSDSGDSDLYHDAEECLEGAYQDAEV